MRSKKLILNSIAGLFLQFLMIVSGLILPRLIILNYGSAVNGLISSITQFLGVIALLRAGVGGVVRAALYKPLANKDNNAISAIVKASEQFLRKIAWIFAALTVLIAITYPFIVKDEFGWTYSALLVLILGIGTFMQYYFGIAFQLLLIADQKIYVYSIIQSLAVILDIIISVLLIKLGMTIHLVKLVTVLSYSFTPLLLRVYVLKNYELDSKVVPNEKAIDQRWDAMGHQLANYVRASVPVLILTFLMPLTEVSVYTVHSFVLRSGIATIISIVFSNTDAVFGNMIAQKEKKALDKNFKVIEFMLFNTCSLLFSSAYVLMPGFIHLYSMGVTDVNYQRPILLAVFTFSELVYCLRIPYYSLINATGQYKQTRNAAIIESICNVLISLILIPLFGVIGAAIGSLCGTLYRTIHLMIYSSKNILNREVAPIIKRVVIGLVTFSISAIVGNIVINDSPSGYIIWVLFAIMIVMIGTVIHFILAFILDRHQLKEFINIIKAILIKKK